MEDKKINISITLTASEWEEMDRLVQKFGRRSRSDLLRALVSKDVVLLRATDATRIETNLSLMRSQLNTLLGAISLK